MPRLRLLVLALLAVAQGCRCGPPGLPDGGDGGGGYDGGTLPDAGSGDGGASDGGDPDGGDPDGGVPDGGAPDAGLDAGSDGGADGGADGGGADAGRGFCEEYFAAQCDWSARCGRLDAPQFADCVDLSRWQCNQRQLDALFDGGKVAFAAANVPACLAGIRAASCALSFPTSPACGLFGPATPSGGSCTRQWSTVCAQSYCAADTCPAQCQPYLGLDAGCTGTFGDECGPAAFCDPGALRCVGLLALGSACSGNDRCSGGLCDTAQGRCLAPYSVATDGGCGSDTVCSAGLYCRAGWCAPSEDVGGPCRLYGGTDCKASLTCRLDGGTTGQCAPRSPLGGPCYGLPNDCDDGLLCDSPSLGAQGSCVGWGSEDAGCLRTLQNCKVGLLCDATSSRCRRLPRVGESCTRDPGNFRSSDCADGFCPGDGGPCRAPQDAGAACERPWECESTECSGGTCAALCTAL